MGSEMRVKLILIALAALLSAGSVHGTGTGIIYSLEHNGTTSVLTGLPLTIDVRATFGEPLSAAAFRIMASGAAGASLTARSANPLEPNGLSFISTSQQSPFQSGLPINLKTTPSIEVLADLDFAPPSPDGLAAGSNILLERITIVPSGTGSLVISISEASGVTTQGAPDGLIIEPVSYGRQSITFEVVSAPTCRNPRYDADGDGDVDGADFGQFQACMTAASDLLWEFRPNPCRCFDRNNDQDVDLSDYQSFQQCLSGPTIAANPACDD